MHNVTECLGVNIFVFKQKLARHCDGGVIILVMLGQELSSYQQSPVVINNSEGSQSIWLNDAVDN